MALPKFLQDIINKIKDSPLVSKEALEKTTGIKIPEKEKKEEVSLYKHGEFTDPKTGQLFSGKVKKSFSEMTIPEKSKSILQGVGSTVKTIAQETARSGASLAIQATEIGTPGYSLNQLLGKVPKEGFKPTEDASELEKKAFSIIFGDKPLKGFKGMGEEILEGFGAEKLAKSPVAPILGGIMAGLDITTGGGKDGIIKAIIKVDKVNDAVKIGKNLGIADNLIDDFAKNAVKAKTAEKANKLLTNFTSKSFDVAKTTTKATGSLAQEARKYKSAEEFVKAQGTPVYHGTTVKNAENIASEGVKPGTARFTTKYGERFGNEFGFSVSKESSQASKYGEKVIEFIIDPEAKIATPKDLPKVFKENGYFNQSEAIKLAKEKGFDGIDLDAFEKLTPGPGKSKELQIFNADIIKTKSQLTDIWEMAQGVKTSPRATTKATTKTTTKVVEAAETAEEILSDMDKISQKARGFNWTQREFLENVSRNMPDVPLYSGGLYVPRSTDRLAQKARTLIQENLDVAERVARETSDRGVAVASELIKHYGDLADKAKDAITKNAFLDKASELAHSTAVNLTALGRAVQAAAIMGRQTPEGILRFAAREINRWNEAVEQSSGFLGLKKKIPNLTAEQTKRILSESKRIVAMEDGIEKAMAWRKLNDEITALVPTPLWKKLLGIWKAGLLTGLKTTGLNTFSNLFHGVSEGIKDIPAAAVDKVSSLFTGKRTLALTTKGTIGGTIEGFQKGWRYLKTGFDERDVSSKLDYKKISFGKSKFAKMLQGYEEGIFRLIGAEDQPFYYGAKARSLQSQAIAQAKNAKLKGQEAKAFIEKLVANPTDEMLKYAVNDAEIAVFQNKTGLGTAARGIQSIGKGKGEFVVPFGRTPAAVATQLINYSPVGIVKTIVENIGKGKFDQRLFSQGLGRAITGTAVMYIGAQMFKNNIITTNYPTDERTQKEWEATGKQPNSILIDGKWRNANVLGPAGNALIVGAKFQEALNDTGSYTQALGQATAGGAKSLTEQTFLSGLNSVLEALNDPSRFASGYVSSTLSSFIPTIIGDIARATDPLERRTNAIPDRLLSKIPGARQTLEPKVNILGEEVLSKGSWLETMIDPSRPSEALESEVIKEFQRLSDVGYKVSPTQLGIKTGYASLTPEENTLLWKKAGQLIQSKITNLINSETYKSLFDNDKAKYLQGFIETANTIARAEMVMAKTQGLEGDELRNKLSELKKSGLMTEDVFRTFLELK